MKPAMKLHTYFRSSAAYRVRIALNLKNLTHEQAFVHLLKDGGQQKSQAYKAVNPQGLVPALEHDGQILTQSLAIIEYLDEVFPATPLLPKSPRARAHVRAFAQAITSDLHPLNNLRVLNYLRNPLGHDQPTVDAWYRHWCEEGLAACEALLPSAGSVAGAFCFGDKPTLADVCLVPQMFAARRFKCRDDHIPRLVAIDNALSVIPAFVNAEPGAQPDAE